MVKITMTVVLIVPAATTVSPVGPNAAGILAAAKDRLVVEYEINGQRLTGELLMKPGHGIVKGQTLSLETP
jgi:hypothetical protein